MKFNINEYVYVRLTRKGQRILRENYERAMGAALKRYPYKPPKQDSKGWSKFQLWNLMYEFGAETCNGSDPCFETTIEIPDGAPGQ